MLFLSRKIDEKINIGDSSWVRFCGIKDGDAVFIICDDGRMKLWSLIMNGKPYWFSNNTSMKYVGYSRGEASLGFDAPDNVIVLREEVEDNRGNKDGY